MKNSVVWMKDFSTDEHEKKYLYHDVYESLFNNFWLLFHKRNALTFHVIHQINDEMKIVKELLFVGHDTVDETLSIYKMYFNEETFGGLEIFSIAFLDKFNLLSKHIRKPIISYDFNFFTLKDNEMVDEHVNVVEFVEHEICPPMEEIMNEKNPLSLWGNEKSRHIYHLWSDTNTFDVTEKGTIVEDMNQFNDNIYNPNFIGSYGQLDNIDINYDNTAEYKRGTRNNVFYDRQEEYDLVRVKKEIEKSYELLAKSILSKIDANTGSFYEIVKQAINHIVKHRDEIYRNHGIVINSKNINKVIKNLRKNVGK